MVLERIRLTSANLSVSLRKAVRSSKRTDPRKTHNRSRQEEKAAQTAGKSSLHPVIRA